MVGKGEWWENEMGKGELLKNEHGRKSSMVGKLSHGQKIGSVIFGSMVRDFY